jgi:hypothetical protein
MKLELVKQVNGICHCGCRQPTKELYKDHYNKYVPNHRHKLISSRKCSICGGDTYTRKVRKRMIPNWHHVPAGVICSRCYHRKWTQRNFKKSREYHKKWNKENKEYIYTYYLNHKERILESHRLYRIKHRKEKSDYEVKYYRDHRDKLIEYQRRYDNRNRKNKE